jgi:hypothetical protein
MDGACAREIERREAAMAIAKQVAKGSIVAKATERLIYQIVEVCAEKASKDLELTRSLLLEARQFLSEECVENYPGDRLPDSFADVAHDLVKRIDEATT